MRLARPWSGAPLADDAPFGPDHCLLTEAHGAPPEGEAHAELLHGERRGRSTHLLLHPYPRRDAAQHPERRGFPLRLAPGQTPRDDDERFAQDALRRMNEVVARVQELEEALDDPAQVWPRLRAAWARAENESDPRMAEIVRQAREMRPRLSDLEKRLRKVLRRTRETTPLDRVQEMDRAAMRWLVRQPGRDIAERAGADQRILATVRHENYDTVENRVLHAYVRLAADVAREWLIEHPRATGAPRYKAVDGYRTACRRFARQLEDLGVGVAQPGVTPNYVLMQDRSYRAVHRAWQRLLARRRAEDDLWAWQAQTWTDFAVLAVVLALDELEEADLVAQSPIAWRAEAVQGRWFRQGRPIAVFWLRETGRVVEVQARPDGPGAPLTLARAHVSLRITDPATGDLPRRVAVWTPHAMHRIAPTDAAAGARARLDEIQRVPANEILRDGLVLTPGHGAPETARSTGARTRVEAVAFDASGRSLADGMEAIRRFARSDIYRDDAA